MKKSWKIFWIISTSITCIGLLLAIVGVALGASYQALSINFPYGYGGDIESKDSIKSEDEFKNIKSIKVNINGGVVEVIGYDGTVVKVESTSSKKNQIQTYLRGEDTLEINTENKRFVNKYISNTKIYVPRNVKYDKVVLDIGAGEMTINDITAQSLKVDVGVGTVYMDNFNSKELDVDCGAGEVVMRTAIADDIEIDNGIGSVQLTLIGIESDYNYKVECGIGTVTIGTNDFTGISKNQTVNNSSDKKLDISCGIGEVVVEYE